jgi:NAD(P)-dependent dehydrogenase (short-subunit alcohol dehydrogenase family)
MNITITATTDSPALLPAQHQTHQPGEEAAMVPRPRSEPLGAPAGIGKLEGKVVLITGGDSGIGHAVALLFAREGASLALGYLDEEADAHRTRDEVEQAGAECILLRGDVGSPRFCREAVAAVIARYGKIDVLINNAAQQYPQENILDISEQQLEKTFRTNIFSMFYMVQAALPHLARGARIINTTSVTAYRGSAHLLDYAATKGAIVAFTRSLAQQLVKSGVHVNAVAPGPVWTPLIPASFPAEEVSQFGAQVPMKRPGQPDEIAPCYLFLATEGAAYMSGQVLHPNGGEIINT